MAQLPSKILGSLQRGGQELFTPASGYLGIAWVYSYDCDPIWVGDGSRQRMIDKAHVSFLVSQMLANGIQRGMPQNRIRVTIPAAVLNTYCTANGSSMPVITDDENQAPVYDSIFDDTGVKLQLQAGQHRLAALEQLATERSIEHSLGADAVRAEQFWLADVWDAGMSPAP